MTDADALFLWVGLKTQGLDGRFDTSLEEDWPVISSLLKALTGDELFDTGDMSQSLCNYCKSHQIHALGVIDASAWKGADAASYRELVKAFFWALVLKYEVSRVVTTNQPVHVREAIGPDALKAWANDACQPHCTVTNFVSSWKNGVAFASLLNHCRKAKGRRDQMNIGKIGTNATATLKAAFEGFTELGIPPMLTPEMMRMGDVSLKRIVIMYVSIIHNCIHTS